MLGAEHAREVAHHRREGRARRVVRAADVEQPREAPAGIDGVAVGLCQGTPVTAMLGGDLTPPVVRVYSTLTLQVGTL